MAQASKAGKQARQIEKEIKIKNYGMGMKSKRARMYILGIGIEKVDGKILLCNRLPMIFRLFGLRSIGTRSLKNGKFYSTRLDFTL